MKEIPLGQGYTALVDDQDYEYVLEREWYLWVGKDEIYARSSVWNVESKIYQYEDMAKYILRRCFEDRNSIDVLKVLKIKHLDGNALNNQRGNLKLEGKSYKWLSMVGYKLTF